MGETGQDTEGALVFVWNADSGWQHAVADSLHKVISPKTYSCKLCQLTYGIAGPKARWTSFLETLGRPVECYHRDEYQGTPLAKEFPGLELPAVLIRTSEKCRILLSRDEIQKMKDLEALLGELKKRSSKGG